MKKILMCAVLMSAFVATAQTPAAPMAAKPGLTLTSSAFEDGGSFPISTRGR